MPNFIIDDILKLKSGQELLDLINKKTEYGAGAGAVNLSTGGPLNNLLKALGLDY
jgi:hypothetical protein